MKKKKKIWLIPIIISIITVLALAIGFLFYNPFLSPIMVKYYSDDQNFCHYQAVLRDVSYEGKGYIEMESIVSLEKVDETQESMRFSKPKVFSKDINIVCGVLKTKIGSTFEFVGTTRVFFDGCPNAIVQITIENEEILSFTDGKEALIEWAKTVH